jgi:hypothetical protein
MRPEALHVRRKVQQGRKASSHAWLPQRAATPSSHRSSCLRHRRLHFSAAESLAFCRERRGQDAGQRRRAERGQRGTTIARE